MSAFFKTNHVTAAFVAAAALMAGSPAFAGTFESNGRTAEVRYADLDLTKSDDQAELKSRLFRAAGRVCPSSDSRERNACRTRALRQVQEPLKAAVAQAETRNRYADATPTKVMVGN